MSIISSLYEYILNIHLTQLTMEMINYLKIVYFGEKSELQNAMMQEDKVLWSYRAFSPLHLHDARKCSSSTDLHWVCGCVCVYDETLPLAW